MNISYLKNKNIHFVECENWHDGYGYEKTEMKEDTINYIEQLQQENKQLKKIKGKNQRTEDVLRQILKYCNYLHNDCKYRLNDGHIRKIRKIIRDYFGEEDKE